MAVHQYKFILIYGTPCIYYKDYLYKVEDMVEENKNKKKMNEMEESRISEDGEDSCYLSSE